MPDKRYPYEADYSYSYPNASLGQQTMKVDVGPIIKQQDEIIALLNKMLAEIQIISRAANLYFWVAVVLLVIAAIEVIFAVIIFGFASATINEIINSISRVFINSVH